MYFDFRSFRKSLQNYAKPLNRTVQDSLHHTPIILADVWKDCLDIWRKNKPQSIGGTIPYVVLGPFLIAIVLAVLIWFAVYNPESKELGWLSVGLYMLLYALSVPIAFMLLALFNIKFGKLVTE